MTKNKLKLGNIVVLEKEFNDMIVLHSTDENPVDSVLDEWALTRNDVEPIEVQYVKERLRDVRHGKRLKTF